MPDFTAKVVIPEPSRAVTRKIFKKAKGLNMEAGVLLDSALRHKGLNPDSWKLRGEKPSEMLFRFSKEMKMTYDRFLTWVLDL
jgi:hypothetical protein